MYTLILLKNVLMFWDRFFLSDLFKITLMIKNIFFIIVV